MTKYYIDTAIWRDYYENRTDRFRPLGEWAFELFRLIRDNNDTVLYSDLIIDELSIDYDKEEIRDMLEILSQEDLLEKIKITTKLKMEARDIKIKYNIPLGDCLHAILAKSKGAIMVTRDKHFQMLSKFVDVKKPEELI